DLVLPRHLLLADARLAHPPRAHAPQGAAAPRLVGGMLDRPGALLADHAALRALAERAGGHDRPRHRRLGADAGQGARRLVQLDRGQPRPRRRAPHAPPRRDRQRAPRAQPHPLAAVVDAPQPPRPAALPDRLRPGPMPERPHLLRRDRSPGGAEPPHALDRARRLPRPRRDRDHEGPQRRRRLVPEGRSAVPLTVPALTDERVATLVPSVTQKLVGLRFALAPRGEIPGTHCWRAAVLEVGDRALGVALSSDQRGCTALGAALFEVA